jgi:hypothetical protein
MTTTFTANGIAGPYGIKHTDKEIQVHGRYSEIVARYPNTETGLMCAEEHCRRLIKGWDKAQRRLRDAAPDLLAALEPIAKFLEQNGTDADYHDADGTGWISRAKAAIAKAKG